MAPQTITVPLDGCEQLMFWLANTNNTSGQYLFYDITLSKQISALELPKAARLSDAIVSHPVHSEKSLVVAWERPKSAGQTEVDSYLTGVSNAFSRTEELLKSTVPAYEIHTYYLETNAGGVCKAVNLKSTLGDNIPTFENEYNIAVRNLEALRELKNTLTNLSISQASAMLGLPELGLRAVSYGKVVRFGSKAVSACNKAVNQMIDEKQAQIALFEYHFKNAVNVDGKLSGERTIFIPLSSGEVPSSDKLQLVENFEAK